jgi:hypothetical protein
MNTATTHTLLAVASLALLTACESRAPQNDTVPEDGAMAETAANDWITLFNGKDLEGWRSYNADAPHPAWIVEDGTIVLDVDDDTEEMTGGDLITERQFEDFELELEWRLSEGGNSGIFYRVREFPEHDVAYLTGIEMQVLDDDRHVDGGEPKTSAGACYALYPPITDVVRPVGEWNSVRLVVNDGHAEHWLNGRKIVEYVIGSGDWNERIANSKFADWEHFAKYPRGHIGLQDHTDRVWFRNIRIREL